MLCEAPGDTKIHKAASLLIKNPQSICWSGEYAMWYKFCRGREQMPRAARRPLWFPLPFHMAIASIPEAKFEERLSMVFYFTFISKRLCWKPMNGWGYPKQRTFADFSGNDVRGGLGWPENRNREPSADVTVPMNVTGECSCSWAVPKEMEGGWPMNQR